MNYEFKNLKKFKLSNGRMGISFFYNEKRFRYFNSSIIGENYNPNTCDKPLKEKQHELLYQSFFIKLKKGWRPIEEEKQKKVKPINIKVIEAVKLCYNNKINLEYSKSYKKDLTIAYNKINDFILSRKYQNLNLSDFSMNIAKDLINFTSNSKRVQLNSKRNYSALLSDIFREYKFENPFPLIKLVKTEEVLHKPIKDIKLVFEELEKYNSNLHLCCLLAYGCLLRPHREIRNLKWGDFNEDCTQISLAGNRNKGKKNRIVPIPLFIQDYLKKGKDENNIFTNTSQAFNEDYFKSLWTKYKKESIFIKKENTLYSFRHTGAINVYEKTGSLNKLQQVMGHGNLNISLTYLRGLEVKQLCVDDMPDL